MERLDETCEQAMKELKTRGEGFRKLARQVLSWYSWVIHFVNNTTQEYFGRTQISWFPDAQRDIATTCVIYLLFDAFKSSFCPTDEEFEERLRLNPLYDYAARNWGHHARAASTDVEQLIPDLLESESKVSACSQAMICF